MLRITPNTAHGAHQPRLVANRRFTSSGSEGCLPRSSVELWPRRVNLAALPQAKRRRLRNIDAAVRCPAFSERTGIARPFRVFKMQAVAVAEAPSKIEEAKTTCKVHFSVRHGVGFGDAIKVVGSSNELGGWETDAALMLNWSDGDVWSATSDLSSEAHEFKFIIAKADGSVEWEDGGNRQLVVSSTPDSAFEHSIECMWGAIPAEATLLDSGEDFLNNCEEHSITMEKEEHSKKEEVIEEVEKEMPQESFDLELPKDVTDHVADVDPKAAEFPDENYDDEHYDDGGGTKETKDTSPNGSKETKMELSNDPRQKDTSLGTSSVETVKQHSQPKIDELIPPPEKQRKETQKSHDTYNQADSSTSELVEKNEAKEADTNTRLPLDQNMFQATAKEAETDTLSTPLQSTPSPLQIVGALVGLSAVGIVVNTEFSLAAKGYALLATQPMMNNEVEAAALLLVFAFAGWGAGLRLRTGNGMQGLLAAPEIASYAALVSGILVLARNVTG